MLCNHFLLDKTKYILLLFLIAHLTFGQKSNTDYVLVGRIKKGDTLQKATLLNTVSGKEESTRIKNGQFVFTGHVEYPSFAFIKADNVTQQVIWLSNDSIQVDFDVNQNALQINQIKGPQDAIDHLYHSTTLYPLYQQKKYQQINDSIRAYVGAHLNSFYSVNLISTYMEVLGPSATKELLASISTNAKQSKEAQYLAQRIQRAETNTLGKKIQDFSLPDTTGKARRLSSFIKPYTNIHFWASWCVPCREHSPEMVAFRKATDPNQVQFIGVSLDENKQAWIRAIQKDKMNWIHLSDLQGFDGEVVKSFSVISIPYLLLVDQNYKILATTLEDAKRLIQEK
jgi:thiol-disulfide isomerase/thioredoxin